VEREWSAMARLPTNLYAGLFQPPAPPVTTVDERALGRILTAVGNKFIPASLDRVDLWNAIEKAAKAKENFDRFKSGPRTRALIKAMNRIGKAADALTKIVKENGDAAQLIAEKLPDALTIVQQIIDCSVVWESGLNESNKNLRTKYDRIPSSREWLVGVELPNIFEEFFGRKAARSRNDGKPAGPTVRFISAVMDEIDCASNSETIIRAMTRYSKLRNLRRAVRGASE
jgi:hypothetical protein